MLTLNNHHNTYPDSNWPSRRFWKDFEKFCPRLGFESENLKEDQHANYLCYWCLDDIDVVQRVVYLIFRWHGNRSASIRIGSRFEYKNDRCIKHTNLTQSILMLNNHCNQMINQSHLFSEQSGCLGLLPATRSLRLNLKHWIFQSLQLPINVTVYETLPHRLKQQIIIILSSSSSSSSLSLSLSLSSSSSFHEDL